ncbi:MAG TPA: CocE/NonD family hydrolase [Steroidobacteraceae bacterium]|nr:CocE/NonD family hydrolase [Steroidobacteraceae bacterium]
MKQQSEGVMGFQWIRRLFARCFGNGQRGARVLALGLMAGLQAVAAGQGETAPAAAGKTPGGNLLDLLGVRGKARLYETVPLELRDGTVLSATLLVPQSSQGARFPTILIQTPYAPEFEADIGLERSVLGRLIVKGYAVAIVNVRGTQWSEGEYHWMKGARDDGLDTLNWITAQSWSNGKVGTYGCSSSGEVQLPLAMANPPALKAVVAMGAATAAGVIPGFADQGVFYMGGVPSFDWAWWYHGNGYHHHPQLPRNISIEERVALSHAFDSVSRYRTEDLDWASHLPSATLLDSIGSPETEFNKLIRLAPNSAAWRDYDFVRSGQSTTVPILHVDSWYDTIEVYGTARLFEYLSASSPDEYLVIGGSAHCRQGSETAATMVGNRPIGDARFEFATLVVKWFDHFLKDEGSLDMPRVQYYPLESNHWTSGASWPPKAARRRLYLASTTGANSASGDGALVERVAGGKAADAFIDNPLDPVPTLGGGCCTDLVSLDQAPVEGRRDVLVYTSAPLRKPLDIAGYVTVHLSLSSSAPDGDVMVKLVDVYPDGRAFNMTDTALRLRYRDGIDQPHLMTPDSIYRVSLGQMAVASHFAPGHRLRVEVAGTNFPEYERNLHTGGRNFDESAGQPAHVRVFHDRGHESYIELPVRP